MNWRIKKITLVIGILDDKPFQSIFQSLLPHCSQVILTEPKIDRRMSPKMMIDVAKALVQDTKIVMDVGEAVRHAIQMHTKRWHCVHCRFPLCGWRSKRGTDGNGHFWLN